MGRTEAMAARRWLTALLIIAVASASLAIAVSLDDAGALDVAVLADVGDSISRDDAADESETGVAHARLGELDDDQTQAGWGRRRRHRHHRHHRHRWLARAK